MTDNGMGHEAGIMARVMMEHTIVMHWIIERGNEGVDALLASQSKRMNAWVARTTSESSLVMPPEIKDEVADREVRAARRHRETQRRLASAAPPLPLSGLLGLPPAWRAVARHGTSVVVFPGPKGAGKTTT
jgi:hypothetical protein